MELDNSFGYLLNVAARLMKQHLDSSLAKYKITTSQWAVLKVISEHGKLTQVEIAALIHSDKATLGAILENLRNRDLIAKENHATDKRAYLISLTDQAKSVLSELSLDAKQCNSEVEALFSKQEIEDMKNNLHKIINNIGELR